MGIAMGFQQKNAWGYPSGHNQLEIWVCLRMAQKRRARNGPQWSLEWGETLGIFGAADFQTQILCGMWGLYVEKGTISGCIVLSKSYPHHKW